MKALFAALRRIPMSTAAKADRSRYLAVQSSKAGDLARDSGDWLIAADHYARSLQYNNKNSAVAVQYGNVLKEAGRIDFAIGAYRQAIELAPKDADTYLQLGHALKLSNRPNDAIEAYAKAVELAPNLKAAREELIIMGARNRLPSAATGKTAASLNLAELHRLLEEGTSLARTINAGSTYPLENYNLFRHHYPIQMPPESHPDTLVLVLVDAVNAPAFSIRDTLTSLQNQRHFNWKAVVRLTIEDSNHPVASLSIQDNRISFEQFEVSSHEIDQYYNSNYVLHLDSGTIMSPESLGWLIYAAKRTNSDITYSDHDSYETHWQYGTTYKDPILHPVFDPDEMESTPWVPIAIFANSDFYANVCSDIKATCSNEFRRSLLSLGSAELTKSRIPRILFSRHHQLVYSEPVLKNMPMISDNYCNGSILVIIPSRDEPEMLKKCIDSLHDYAKNVERLDILVVDNNSTDLSKIEFSKIKDSGKARFIEANEPFNWSRFNNIAVDNAAMLGSKYQAIVFANNDIVAVSHNWDEQILQALQDPSIGVLGARLLYPNGEIQHAGILFGGHDNRPVHDGLLLPAHSSGPLNRLGRRRGVAAVTGAFMAVRPDVFEALGGFDTTLAIAYNDVDFCLKCRAAGYRVVYEPKIELVHYESVSRGTNFTPDRVEWDEREFKDLYDRWGEWLFFDPTRNPQWTSSHLRPFEGFRDLSLSEVLSDLDKSARPRPWSVTSKM